MAEKPEANGNPPRGGVAVLDRGVFAIRKASVVPDDVVDRALLRLVQNKEIVNARATMRDSIAAEGLSDDVQKLTVRLNRTGLSSNDRLLLQQPGVYEYVVKEALDTDKVDPKDTTGLYESVLRNFERQKHALFELIVRGVLRANSVDLHPKPYEFARLIDAVASSGVSFSSGNVERRVLELQRQIAREGNLPELVDLFAKKDEIPTAKFTADVKSAMVRYLQGLDLDATKADIDAGTYDEYFAVAYDHALGETGRDGRADPILLTRADGNVADWDGTITFPARADELAGYVPANVRIAGAVKYLYDYDHLMGIFRVVKALILRWASGSLEIVDGDLQNRAYRYYKLLSDGSRISDEETEMVYRTVLGSGDAELLSRMAPNDGFQPQWDKLMTAVAQYIADSQDAAKDAIVSRNPIFQAIEELQVNLSNAVTGMVRKQAAEVKGKFDDAVAILGHPEIAQSVVPGPQKTFLKVIERISREEFGTAPDVYSIRTMAEEGYKVVDFVSGFDRGSVRDDDFEAFKESAEAWIIAAATVTERPTTDMTPAPSTDGEPDPGTDDEDAW